MSVNKQVQNNITIDLGAALTACAYGDDSLLQVQAKRQLESLLEKFKAQLKSEKLKNEVDDWDLEFNPKRFNNAIFISGQRGAGKTTFLRSILHEQATLPNGIKPIAFIDPTLIEVHEHILVQIIAKLKEHVIKALRKSKDEVKQHEFHECIEDMAEGLKLLSSRKADDDKDAAWFLKKALKHAVGGQTLEQKLNTLIDKAAEILGEKLLLIAFDDVDTNTNEAFNVLELIRKYLTSPRLVVLISGDPSLYSHIVQGQRAKELSNNHSSIKGMDVLSQKIPDLVSHLEQQYLAKVLPVEHRVELKNIASLVADKSGQKIILKLRGNKVDEIYNHLNEILSTCLKVNKQHLKVYVDFILHQPIRTVLQILKYVDEHDDDSKPKALFTAMANSYVGSLRKESLSMEELSDMTVHQHTIGLSLFQLCLKHGELETGFYGRPDGKDDSYNTSMFLLSSLVSNYLNAEGGPTAAGKGIQLMLAGGGSSTIYMNHVINNLNDKASHIDYVNYIGLNRTQDSFGLAAHFSPLILTELPPKKQLECGIIRTPRRNGEKFLPDDFADALKVIKPSNEDGKRFTNVRNLLAAKNHGAKDAVGWALKLVAISTHSLASKGEGKDYISAYCLLASLSELLVCKDDLIESTLNRLSNIQTYGAPSFIGNQNVITNSEGADLPIEPDESADSDGDGEGFKDIIVQWKSVNAGDFNLSSLVLGKVWTRIIYSLDNLSIDAKKPITASGTEKGRRDILLSEVISRFVWSIINATLIEESRYQFKLELSIQSSLGQAKNVNTAPTELTRNLKYITGGSNVDNKELQRKLPLTYLLLTCPLFWPFLSATSEDDAVLIKLKEEIKLFLGEIPPYLSSMDNYSDAMVLISRLPIMGFFNK